MRKALRTTRLHATNTDEDKATGPDCILGAILKRTRRELAAPITRLACRLLTLGAWPDICRYHWIVPLYKRKSVHNPLHYRGVHLTPVLSKVVEQLISNVLISFWVMTSGRSRKTQLQKLGHPLGGTLDHGKAYRQQSWHQHARYCRRLRPCLFGLGGLAWCAFLRDLGVRPAARRGGKQYVLAKCRRSGASDTHSVIRHGSASLDSRPASTA